MTTTARFENVSCSQCGGTFGPGEHGFSHCDNHQGMSMQTNDSGHVAGGKTEADTSMNIDLALEKFIDVRDRRIMKVDPVAFTPPMRDAFTQLLKTGKVIFGGRASCGGAVDPTWRKFTSWNEVVSKASKIGYEIKITPIKHKNGSPTRAGGFWDESEYTLVRNPLAKAGANN